MSRKNRNKKYQRIDNNNNNNNNNDNYNEQGSGFWADITRWFVVGCCMVVFWHLGLQFEQSKMYKAIFPNSTVSNSSNNSNSESILDSDDEKLYKKISKNPYDDMEVTSLRDIESDFKAYAGKDVLIGPVAIWTNDIHNHVFSCGSVDKPNSLGLQLDTDTLIDVDYSGKDVKSNKKIVDLKSTTRPIVYVKGKVMYDVSSNRPSLKAYTVHYVGDKYNN